MSKLFFQKRFHTNASIIKPDNIIPCQRELFDIPDDIHYFNFCYIGAGLKTSYDGGLIGIERKMHPWHLTQNDFFTESYEYRELASKLLHNNCTPNDISIIPSASYGFAFIAKNIGIQLKERIDKYGYNSMTPYNILCLHEQFPSAVYCWMDLVKQFGEDKLKINFVKKIHGRTWTDCILEYINDETIVCCLPNVHWTNGSLIDIHKVSEYISNNYNDCQLILDVTQSIGVKPFPKNIAKIDYIVTAGYKWLMGPYGLAFMYTNPTYHDNNIPLEFNWLNRKDSIHFNRLVNYRDEYDSGAIKFDMGGRSLFNTIPMGIASLKQILNWDVNNIYNTLKYYNNIIGEELMDNGFDIIKNEDGYGHILGVIFNENDINVNQLLSKFKGNNIYVSIRGNAIRIAPHLHLREHEYNFLVKCILSVMKTN